MLKIPDAPNALYKGYELRSILGPSAIRQMSHNFAWVYPKFDQENFIKEAKANIETLSLSQRSEHIAGIMHKYLPQNYYQAIQVITDALTDPLQKTANNGLAVMFYMPHCNFVALYGIDPKYNAGKDPFDCSMQAQYQLTKRFTCEYSIRPFIVSQPARTLDYLYQWMLDKDPHVRRLCSEGTRPRLPWSKKIDSFIKDPSAGLKILEQLKDDEDLYVRRSVANHLGDIAKDHLELALKIAYQWLEGASRERKWIIRHALRYPDKIGIKKAQELRKLAK